MTVTHAVLILKTSFLLLKKKKDCFSSDSSVTSLRQTRTSPILNSLSLLTSGRISRICFGDAVPGHGGVSISQHSALLFPEKQNFLLVMRVFYQGFSSSDLHVPCWEVFLLFFYHWKVNVILKCPLSQPRFSRGAYSFP